MTNGGVSDTDCSMEKAIVACHHKGCMLPIYKADLCPNHYAEFIHEGYEKSEKPIDDIEMKQETAVVEQLLHTPKPKRTKRKLSWQQEDDRFIKANNIVDLEKPEEVKIFRLILAALRFGTNADTLALKTGFKRDWVRERSKRMRENQIWKNGKVGLELTISEYRKDPGYFITELALHSLVAEGTVVRVKGS